MSDKTLSSSPCPRTRGTQLMTTCPPSLSPAHTTATTTGVKYFSCHHKYFCTQIFSLVVLWNLEPLEAKVVVQFLWCSLQTGLQRDLLLIKQIISCSTSKGNFRNSVPRHQSEISHCKTSKWTHCCTNIFLVLIFCPKIFTLLNWITDKMLSAQLQDCEQLCLLSFLCLK